MFRMIRVSLALSLLVSLTACATATLPTRPNDREWNSLLETYHQIEAVRRALPQPMQGAPRRQQIETALENQKRIEPSLQPFLERLNEYLRRTSDQRAARLWSNERIRMGDTYMYVLARYERAIDYYRSALEADPTNEQARERISLAEKKRYVSMDGFGGITSGMTELDVTSRLGMPREDWIRHLRRDGRIYSVWIYSKADGGAAAVYFDDGIVYHTNWNAAAPAAEAP
jgi:tetratricopeptide (TPR) repeat protein